MALLWVLVLHTYTWAFTCALNCARIWEMHSFVNTFLYNARRIPPLALHSQQNPLHCLNVNNKRETQSIQHTASSQSRQVEAGSRRCVYTHTHTHTHTHKHIHTQTQMSLAVYVCSHTHFKWRDEASLCWWMFFFPSLKQARISLHKVAKALSGRKRERKGKERQTRDEEREEESKDDVIKEVDD